MLAAGLGFYLTTLVYPGVFLVFIVYKALALLGALAAYVFLTVRGPLEGAGFMAAGILVSIIAAGIQSRKSIALTLIWQFDCNGVYHIVQAAGLVLLLIGLRLSIQSC
jgi:hypothetical protein